MRLASCASLHQCLIIWSSRFRPQSCGLIDEFGNHADSVCLEITESAVVRDIETTRRTLAKLKEVAVQIAIDDFGTGYASCRT
jgi:EAL domain-containing protein (putative c-di-GMP-specific phosphodiesterase class I)